MQTPDRFTPFSSVGVQLQRARTLPVGLLARLRGWLAASALFAARRAEKLSTFHVPIPTGNSTIVPFPVNGRGLLLQLARDLQRSVATEQDPVLLTLSTGPAERLLIDSTAYVDLLRTDQLPYRVVLGDGLTTRITLETAEFREARAFALQYLLLTRGPTGGAL